MPYNDQIARGDASALIPEDTAREIIQALPAQSVALTRFRRATMSRKQQRMPVLSALPTAYFRNGDTGLAQTTKQAWANKYLDAEELVAIVPIPKAVIDDSEFDMWAEIRPRLVEALGAVIDGAVLFGAGKPGSWPAAIVTGAAAAGNSYVRGSVPDQDLAEDVNQVMGLIEADGFMVNGHAAAPTLKASFRGLRDQQGGLLFQPSLQAGTPGFSVEVYGSKLGTAPEQSPGATKYWTKLDTTRDFGTDEKLNVGGTYHHVLVWFTDQPADTKVMIPELSLLRKKP